MQLRPGFPVGERVNKLRVLDLFSGIGGFSLGLAARVLALHDAGMAYNAIGRAIGLSWWTAKRIVRAACKARAAGGAA